MVVRQYWAWLVDLLPCWHCVMVIGND